MYYTHSVVVQYPLLLVNAKPPRLPTLQWVSPLLQLAFQGARHCRVLSLLVKLLRERKKEDGLYVRTQDLTNTHTNGERVYCSDTD